MEKLKTFIEFARQVGVFMNLPESQEKILLYLALNGEKDAYGTHKNTGIKLTTTQAAMKGLDERGLITVLKIETSIKGQKKVIYRLTEKGLIEAIKCCYKGNNIRHEDILRIINTYQNSGPLLFKHWEELVRADPDLLPELELLLFKAISLSPLAPKDVDDVFFVEVTSGIDLKPTQGRIIDALLTVPGLAGVFQEVLNDRIDFHQKQLKMLSKYACR